MKRQHETEIHVQNKMHVMLQYYCHVGERQSKRFVYTRARAFNAIRTEFIYYFISAVNFFSFFFLTIQTRIIEAPHGRSDNLGVKKKKHTIKEIAFSNPPRVPYGFPILNLGGIYKL